MKTYDAHDLQLEIDQDTLRPLYKTKPVLHALAIVFNWVIILTTIALCIRFFHPLLYLLAVIIIGARMHALAILMHDASHFRFLKRKQWNDLITNYGSMYLLFSSIEKYRNNHLRHHRHLNTEDDPDWLAKLGRQEFEFPKSKKDFLKTVFSYFFLVKGVQDAVWFFKRFGLSKEEGASAKPQSDKLIFYVGLIILLTVMNWWLYFALYWLVPLFSTFWMFQYIRSVAEHFGELSYDHLLTSTRCIKANKLEQFFFAPHNVSYHLEHHLYPGVPFYHLPELHEVLMTDQTFREKAHITHGFCAGLLNELGSLEVEKGVVA